MVYPPETSGPGGFARRARASGVSIRRRFLTRLSLIALPLSVTLLLLGGVVPAIATPVFVSGWGAQEGLHRFDPDSGIFTQLNASGPDNPDLAIGLDGTIWLTTFGSLNGIAGGYRAVAAAPIPEPSTGLLLGLGLVFIASANRRLRAAPPQR